MILKWYKSVRIGVDSETSIYSVPLCLLCSIITVWTWIFDHCGRDCISLDCECCGKWLCSTLGAFKARLWATWSSGTYSYPCLSELECLEVPSKSNHSIIILGFCDWHMVPSTHYIFFYVLNSLQPWQRWRRNGFLAD